MPIRFRCTNCERLLGIARRKAGTQITCPQCGESITVPHEIPEEDRQDQTLRGLDDLLGPSPSSASNGAVLAPPEPALITQDIPAPAEPVAVRQPTPRVIPRPAPKRVATKEDSLFEQNVDALLGIARPDEALSLDDERPAKPVTGMDAMSLDDGPGTIVLSSQRATLLAVAAALLMLLAFVAGFAIRSSI